MKVKKSNVPNFSRTEWMIRTTGKVKNIGLWVQKCFTGTT